MGIFSSHRGDAVELDHAHPASQASLWERFDAAERERRIDEFIAADAEQQIAEWRKYPSITDRATKCPRCGQGKSRHTVSTGYIRSCDYEICVREVDGDVVLSKSLYFRPYFFETSPRQPIRVFRGPTLMHLNVTCECGSSLGSYRPLNYEPDHERPVVI